MIVYDLRCLDCNHRFEGWFPSSGAFDTQKQAGDLLCAACGSLAVDKALMAPAVKRTDKAADAPRKMARPSHMQAQAQMKQMLLQLRRHVESECDYVGDKFAEEARRIHKGEAEERGIYGETTPDEAEALLEEGVDVSPLPWIDHEDA